MATMVQATGVVGLTKNGHRFKVCVWEYVGAQFDSFRAVNGVTKWEEHIDSGR